MLGQCPKFNRFLILERSLILYMFDARQKFIPHGFIISTISPPLLVVRKNKKCTMTLLMDSPLPNTEILKLYFIINSSKIWKRKKACLRKCSKDFHCQNEWIQSESSCWWVDQWKVCVVGGWVVYKLIIRTRLNPRTCSIDELGTYAKHTYFPK